MPTGDKLIIAIGLLDLKISSSKRKHFPKVSVLIIINKMIQKVDNYACRRDRTEQKGVWKLFMHMYFLLPRRTGLIGMTPRSSVLILGGAGGRPRR